MRTNSDTQHAGDGEDDAGRASAAAATLATNSHTDACDACQTDDEDRDAAGGRPDLFPNHDDGPPCLEWPAPLPADTR